MISWIQRTFQQHFKIVFGALLAITIVSFIFTIGAAPGFGRAKQKVLSRPFFDLNLGSQADQQRLFGDANLSVLLRAGFQAIEGAQLQEYALQRYASLALAEKLNVPVPTSNDIAEYAKGLRLFAGADGQFDLKRYTDFRDSLKNNSRLSEGDVSRVMSDNIRAQRAEKLLGGPGYVLPSDIKSQMVRADSTWTVGVATIDYASFKPTITPSDADLSKFFEENTFRYEIPAKIAVSYVLFPATNYVNAVTATDQEVKAYYDANPARFPKPAEKVDDKTPKVNLPTPPSDPTLDFAIVRPQVEDALRREKAGRLAAKAASDFTLALYEKKLKSDSPEFAQFIAAQKVSLKEVAPFSRDSVPVEFGTNPEVGDEAFKLTKERYFSDAMTTTNGSVVMFLKDTLPARQPAIAEVHDKVLADYVESERHKRFVELGKSLRPQLEAKLKAGEPIEKASPTVAASANVKIEAKTFPAFTLRQRPQDLDYSILGAIENMKQGELSEMIISQDKGRFVYAVEKKVPEITEANPQYVATRNQISQYLSAHNGDEYVRELVERELAKSSSEALR